MASGGLDGTIRVARGDGVFRRTLGLFSLGAVAFSFMSPSTGIALLFASAYKEAGSAVWWTWIVVCAGQLCVGYVFARLAQSSAVPAALYYWVRAVSGRRVASLVAVVYLVGGILTLSAAAMAFPIVLQSLYPTSVAARYPLATACCVVVLATALAAGRSSVAASINNLGVAAEAFAMCAIGVALLCAPVRHHTATPPVDTTQIMHLVRALPMSLFVFFGFDCAASLGEESLQPDRAAPRAIVLSVSATGIAGAVFLGGLLRIASSSTHSEPAAIIADWSPAAAKLFLIVVLIAVLACCVSVCIGCSRCLVGVARAGIVPAAEYLRNVSARANAPRVATLVCGSLALLPLMSTPVAVAIPIAATCLVYVAYVITTSVLCVNVALRIMAGRGSTSPRSWPREVADLCAATAGTLFLAAMIVILAIPSTASNPPLGGIPLLGAFAFVRGMPVVWGVLTVTLGLGMTAFVATRSTGGS